jgi:mono/diheme cytochrome c family protein
MPRNSLPQHPVAPRARNPFRAALAAAISLALGFGAAAADASREVRFSRDILPLLSDHCFACHGPDEKGRKGGLRLDTRDGALGRGKSGETAVVAGQPERSELVRRITATDPDDLMPPAKSNHRLTADQIALFRLWIEQGAEWGRHWSYEPPVRPPVPEIPGWVSTGPVDAFLRARLRRDGLEPSPEASRSDWIRRVTLDLTGLPPTPNEVEAFRRDVAQGAHERVVDRLLASPRYGERMAWDWLEAARYADSNGYQGDSERTMWPWRDWVVDAFNRNLPYDRFTVWQLAGDRLPAPTHEQRLATGFLRNHMINGEGGRIAEENRIDYLFDQTETVATVWMGATFNCTRCHDHKYDPHTRRDYFSLLAFFDRTVVDGGGGNPQNPPNLAVPSPEQSRRAVETERALDEAARAVQALESERFPRPDGKPASESAAAKELPKELQETLKTAPRDRDPGRLGTLAAHWKSTAPAYHGALEALRGARDRRNAAAWAIPYVMVMDDAVPGRVTRMLERGNYLKPGEAVPMALPAAVAGNRAVTRTNRLDLAEWLVSRDNPLTARVTVNRFWQSLFGVGLVKTSEDFGLQGERPVHPELLDWLAVEFMESGWDVKRLIRLMATSAAYRQSSRVTPALAERDPENRLVARGPRFRMPSWMIRDTALAAAGLLSDAVGGSPVKPYQPSGVWEEATFGTKRYEQDHGEALYRRSLYVFWRRIVGPTFFFDTASRQTCTVRTPRTNVPLHALLTLNDTAYVEAARVLAARVLAAGPDDDARLDALGLSVLGRRFSKDERAVLSRGLDRHRRRFLSDPSAAAALLGVGESRVQPGNTPAEHAAWTVVSGTVLNLDEALSQE